MMSRPVVSVIAPTHNHERFIGECIDSVLAQTYENWELVIVDDGSTDCTPRIIRQYAAREERIKTFVQSNKGPGRLSETYNLALEHSQGEWIAILEGDDYWFPQKLERQVAALTERTIVSYGVYVDRLAEKLQEGRRPPFQGTLPLRQFIPYLLLHQSFMIGVTVLVRKDSLMTIGGFHQDGSPAAVDMATMMRLAQLRGEVVYIGQPLGVWRHHRGQSTSTHAVELARFNTALVLQFYDALPVAEKQVLRVSRQDIVRARRAHVAEAYFSVLRAKLKERDKEGIGRLIAGTWKYGGIKRKAQALYAVGATVMGYDFEPILRWAQKLAD